MNSLTVTKLIDKHIPCKLPYVLKKDLERKVPVLPKPANFTIHENLLMGCYVDNLTRYATGIWTTGGNDPLGQHALKYLCTVDATLSSKRTTQFRKMLEWRTTCIERSMNVPVEKRKPTDICNLTYPDSFYQAFSSESKFALEKSMNTLFKHVKEHEEEHLRYMKEVSECFKTELVSDGEFLTNGTIGGKYDLLYDGALVDLKYYASVNKTDMEYFKQQLLAYVCLLNETKKIQVHRAEIWNIGTGEVFVLDLPKNREELSGYLKSLETQVW